MIKKNLLILWMLGCVNFQSIAEESDYRILCTNVVTALANGRLLTSSSFTNQLHTCVTSTNIRVRALAKLVLSDALLTMYDKSSDFAAYDEGCLLVSNVLFSTELPTRSWQKSVASLFYAWALRIDGKKDLALSVCCTALSSHLASPTTDVECAVWSAISSEDGLPEMSITNSLKLAAALSVPVERRPSEWGSYTNGLPAQAVQILLE
jgi:hypothetical protein